MQTVLKKTTGIGRNLTKNVTWVLAMVFVLAGCTSSGLVRSQQGMKVLFVKPWGVKTGWLSNTTPPTLVIKSKEGFGQARLRLPASMPQGMVIELPGLQSLEEFVLDNGKQQFVCTGGREEKVACRFGEEWPVGVAKRYATGMTVEIPAHPFTKAQTWTLHWVDYWR